MTDNARSVCYNKYDIVFADSFLFKVTQYHLRRPI